VGEGEGVGQRCDGGRHPVRVVRCVEQHGRARPHDLEPPGRGDPREALADEVRVEHALVAPAEERLDGGERGSGVRRLVGAVQGQEDVVVAAAQALQGQQLPADGGVRSTDAELEALAGDGGARPRRSRRSSTCAASGCCGRARRWLPAR
jgi:hypothetical protein